MAPISTEAEASSGASICINACSLQVIMGCVIPLVAVASTIPAIMIRKRLATKRANASFGAPRAQTRTTTPRIQATSRLPCTSVYIARVDYYLPTSNTVASRSVAESESKDSLNLPRAEVNDDINDSPSTISSSPELPYLAPPMVSLPSLSSMLCEFTVYADAIEPEYLTEARRSSTCLLDSALSSMDVKALSLAELPTIPSAVPTKIEAPLVVEGNATSCPLACSQADIKNGAFHSASAPLRKEPPLFYGEEEVGTEKDKGFVTPVDDALRDNDFETDVEELNTSNLVPTTTSWSIIFSSSSTLASLLAVRLSQFPAVPTFPPLPPINFAATSMSTRHSESSLGSTFTCSASAPASLNILDIHLDSVIPRRRPLRPFLLDYKSSTPGELWDDEDDLLYCVCLPRTAVDLSRTVRHTWTAGFCNANVRSEKGELWDDDDDRRFSFAGEITMVEPFVSSSMLSIELPDDSVVRKPSLDTIDSASPADQTCHEEEEEEVVSGDIADQALCISESGLNFNDLGFAEIEKSCFDVDVGSDLGKAQEMTYIPFVEDLALSSEPEASSSSSLASTPSSFCPFAFEDPDVDVDVSTSIYLSESSRPSSFMSFASVLDDTIRVMHPIYDEFAAVEPGKAERECENQDQEKKMFEVVDMELEPDMSYSSRIISVNYPLFREMCAF